jgi:hypothetical protein
LGEHKGSATAALARRLRRGISRYRLEAGSVKMRPRYATPEAACGDLHPRGRSASKLDSRHTQSPAEEALARHGGNPKGESWVTENCGSGKLWRSGPSSP